MRFFYGVPSKKVEVTDKISGTIIDMPYNEMFGDPCPNEEKTLFVEGGKEEFSFPEDTLPLHINYEEKTVYRIQGERKYFLSLYAIFKNESVALEEWLKHYIKEGVEHFYLINNGSTDNYQEIIKKYHERITLYSDSTPYRQVAHYNRYLARHNHESDWIILVDLDEFLYSRKGYSKISDYLETLPNNISRVVLFWKNFGSNGHIEQPPSIIQGFTRRYPLKPCLGCHILHSSSPKSIFRGNKAKKLDQHLTKVEGRSIFPNGKFIDIDYGNVFYYPLQEDYYTTLPDHSLHLNHYKIQSYKWFTEVKSKRGDVTNPMTNNYRNDEYFKKEDTNEEEDLELAKKVY